MAFAYDATKLAAAQAAATAATGSTKTLMHAFYGALATFFTAKAAVVSAQVTLQAALATEQAATDYVTRVAQGRQLLALGATYLSPGDAEGGRDSANKMLDLTSTDFTYVAGVFSDLASRTA